MSELTPLQYALRQTVLNSPHMTYPELRQQFQNILSGPFNAPARVASSNTTPVEQLRANYQAQQEAFQAAVRGLEGVSPTALASARDAFNEVTQRALCEGLQDIPLEPGAPRPGRTPNMREFRGGGQCTTR
ncbi:MAG: hypothetical protein K2Q12_01655 [Rickettsiales bacterium]|nr:hypothetical protein [Rickettsiales bacterium]